MIYKVVSNFPHEILNEKEGPFISLYQPTFRYRPENKQDLIRFKNLVTTIQNSLLQKYSKEEVNTFLKPFNEIAENKLFWNNTKDGLCILSSKNETVVYLLNRPVDEIAIVADSFHTKPLIRVFQSADRYHLLGINRKNFVLYEGNRYGLNQIDFPEGSEVTIEEVLGDQYTKPYLNPGSYGGAGGTPMFHGQGGRKDEIEKDTEKYFRYIDKFINDNYSKADRIPLVLVGLTEHQGLFRSLSSNPSLIGDGIKKDFEALSLEDIRAESWKILEPFYLEKTNEFIEKFKLAQSRFQASDDLAQVVRAAFEGRIDSLLLEAEKVAPGKINKETGQIIKDKLDNPDFDDILDDLAEMVLRMKGKVLILPKERMPSPTGLAGIYKF